MEEETEKKQKFKAGSSETGGLRTPKGSLKAKRTKIVRRIKVQKKVFRKR